MLLFAAISFAQKTNESSAEACERALSDQGLSHMIPALKLKSVRSNACVCILGNSFAEKTSSASSGNTGIYRDLEGSAKSCITSAIAAEPTPDIPAVILASLRDAMQNPRISPAFVEPKLIKSSCKPPDYPTTALDAQAAGATKLAFQIGVRGKPTDAEISRTAGRSAAHKLLDVTALFALMQCDFEPATLNGKPVNAWVEVTYVWKLQ